MIVYKRILLITILILTSQLFYGQNTTVPYNASNDDIMNPDRGFYYPVYPPGTMGNFAPMNTANLIDLRENLYTPPNGGNYQVRSSLFFRYYILDNSTDNLGLFPSQLQQDFDAVRQAGGRLIVRFAYTITPNTTSCNDNAACPPYGDAPKSRVLSHIAQLKPVLQANEDVISVVQNGFIGVWGEQYYTDYFGFGNLAANNWQDRIDVVSALLDAVPANRMVQVRYPQMKQKYLYGVNAPVTSPAMTDAQAYNGTDISRLGFHNDCFLSSPNDVGTYLDYSNGSDQTGILKPYSGADGRYVAVGGETCADNYAFNNCSGGETAVTTMNDLHYSYINSSYNNEVNNDWQTDGCMAEIKRNLGYRFVMQNGTYPNSASAGSTVSFNINLENQGFAAPYNERALYLVLRNGNNVYKAYISSENNDTRRWYSGNITLNATAILPADIPAGNYELLLHILDFSNNWIVAERPEYSIQLANSGTWEANTGFNKLNHTISIGGTPPPPPSNGCITIDADFSDWSTIPTLSTSNGFTIKTADDNDNFYIYVNGNLGPNNQVFLDTDNDNSGAGEYTYFQWLQSGGLNLMIENTELSNYTGTGTDWTWNVIGQVDIQTSGNALELKIAKSFFNTNTVNFGFVTRDANWTEIGFSPATNTTTHTFSSSLNCGGCDDSDNDGVCDDDDACPGINDALIGTPCDDDNSCTLGETYNSSCQCTNGTYTDADNDGVCVGDDPDDNDSCNPNPCDACISIDGNFSDWESIDILASNGLFTKAADDANALYIYIGGSIGPNYQLFLDADNSNSGANEYSFSYWTGTGFDFLIENGALYAYTGSGTDWSWAFQGQISAQKTNTELELRIEKSLFNANIANFGFLSRDSNWGEIARIPTTNAAAHPLSALLNCDAACPDSDNDNVCDDQDTCPGINDALIGTLCDDGDPCTQGETYNTFCQCGNGTYTDADNDGVCAANDPDDNDPCIPNACDDTCIEIDGGFSDWSAISTLSNSNGFTIKAADDSDDLYIYVAGNIGVNYQVFLDADNNNSGGNEYTYYRWGQTGHNFMVENGTLSAYTGTGADWSWNPQGAISAQRTATAIELKISKSLFTTNTINFGFVSQDATWNEAAYAPTNNIATHILSGSLSCGDNGCPDADGDGVCDADDICPNGNDNTDTDSDGIPNACDSCPTDPTNSCNSTPTYCGASGNNANYEYIERVTFGSINNASGNNGGYADFTAQVTNVGLGDAIPFSLTPGFPGDTYDEAWTIWIDFNRDGDFNDAGEAVYNGTSTGALSGNINIPTNASLGLTGMRVAMQWQSAAPSCGSFSYGEVEDYTVNVGSMAQNYPSSGLHVENETPTPSMRISPNPTSDIINIDFQNIRNEGIIEIYDLTGKSLIKQTIASEADNLTLQVNHLTQGVYIIRLQLDNGTYATKRFVKLSSN